MPRKATAPTMTELLRRALRNAKSINSVAVATGVPKASLIRFVSGRQSLRLEAADKLAAHFGITSHQQTKRRIP